MPFAEFQNGNAGLALPQFQFQSGLQTMEAAGSFMERAQRMRSDQQRLENEKQQLASTLALNTQRVEESRASVKQMTAQTETANLNNKLLIADSDLKIRMLKQLGSAFDSDAPATGGAPSGAVGGFSNFHADALELQSMPQNTPSDLVKFNTKMAEFNSKYHSIAELNPTAKTMFDTVVGRASAAHQAATALLTGRAQIVSRKLAPELGLVSSPEAWRQYVAQNKDDHEAALMDPGYNQLVAKVTDQLGQKQAAWEVEQKKIALEYENQNKVRDQQRAVSVDGFEGLAPTAEAAAKVRENIANYGTTKDALDNLEEIAREVEKDSTKKFSRDLVGKAGVYQQQLISSIGKLQTGGVLTDAEAAKMTKLVPNPTELLRMDSTTKSQLEALRHEMETRMSYTASVNQITRKKVAKKSETPVTDGASLQQALRSEGAVGDTAAPSQRSRAVPAKLQ